MRQYEPGQRVRLTHEGRTMFPRLRSFTGQVVGTTRDGRLVRVLRDGLKRPERWSPTFWRVDTAPRCVEHDAALANEAFFKCGCRYSRPAPTPRRRK